MSEPTPTIEATKAAPARPSAAVARRSRAAAVRSVAGERGLAVLLGVLLRVGGVLVALLGHGVFGAARAGRPLLDPIFVDVLRAYPLASRAVAMVGGLLLVLIGLAWAARAVRPERHPDLAVDGGRPETTITVRAEALAEGVGTHAAELPGVRRARARLVGTTDAPALRITLWLSEDADVRAVLERIDDTVLAVVRSSLDLAALPVAVRLELETASPPPRVA